MLPVEHELFTQVTFPAQCVQTLAWQGDVLVDWAGGHTVFDLEGHVTSGGYTSYGSAFDAAIPAPDGRHVVIYQRLGTKALLLRDGKLERELNRSYYCAEAYEYPSASCACRTAARGWCTVPRSTAAWRSTTH